MKTKFLLIGLLAFLLIGCQAENETSDEFQDCKTEIAEYNTSDINPESGLIEGDIIPHSKIKGNAVKEDRNWPDAIVPFVFNESYDYKDYRDKARQTIQDVSDLTGMTFQEFESKSEMQETYGYGLVIKSSFFGSSSVGRNPYGTQDIYFTFSEDDSTIRHELGHALGLWHEHNRADRDDYIDVNFDNIPEGRHKDFQPHENSVPCGNYDYESLMHYYSYAYAVVKDETTLSKKDGSLIPEVLDFSDNDIRSIRIINGLD